MNFHDSGFPYSDELYHHGIKGQRWGVRRYQNEDGSLTTAGKLRYGAQKVTETLGRGSKRVGSHIGDKIKAKHKWMMSDEELQERVKRMEMEKRYKDLLRDSKPSIGRGKKVVGDILENGAKTIGNRAFNKLADNMFNKEPEPDMSLPSNQLIETYKEQWKGGQSKWTKDELHEFADYVDELRRIEGSKQKKKK